MQKKTILLEIGPQDTEKYEALAKYSDVELSWLLGVMLGYGYQHFNNHPKALQDAIGVARNNSAIALQTETH